MYIMIMKQCKSLFLNEKSMDNMETQNKIFEG